MPTASPLLRKTTSSGQSVAIPLLETWVSKGSSPWAPVSIQFAQLGYPAAQYLQPGLSPDRPHALGHLPDN